MKSLEVSHYRAGSIVIYKNTPKADHFYIVISGQIKTAKENIMIADKEQCIGDQYLLDDSDAGFWEDDLIAYQDIDLASCTKYQFETTIKGKLA